jgi:predicted ATPase
MWVDEIEIERWRNLQGVRLQLDATAPLICLVGENGTGKSSLLELITFAAHHWGLGEPAALKRPFPESRFQDHRLQVALRLTDEERARIPEIDRPECEAWDGRLLFESASAPENAQPMHPGTSTQHFHGEGIHMFRAFAGGDLEPGWSAHVATEARKVFVQEQALLHLYIDAERFFPPHSVQDADVVAASREQLDLPNVLRQQAAQLSHNAYHLWMRAMLGRQQRMSTEYLHLAQAASREGAEIPAPPDPLGSYRDALVQVLPHLRFERLDDQTRSLVFNAGTSELTYEQLSGGEREIAFLVGQLDRFQIGNGLFLLDEPELHLNPELVRGWVEYLRSTVRGSQAWIATHSLEAVEVAGLSATLVLVRDEDGIVRDIRPLVEQPTLQALASSVGSPAFSLSRSRFVLIEGEMIRGERQRFRNAFESGPDIRYLESGGCKEVIRRHEVLAVLAAEEPQLRFGAIIDRDFRDQLEIDALRAQGILVLPVHEVENLFLFPNTVSRLCEQAGRNSEDAHPFLRAASDEVAGRWILQSAVRAGVWEEVPGPAVGISRTLAWSEIAGDPQAALTPLCEALDDDRAEQLRRRVRLVTCAERYRSLRDDPEHLWQECLGKEVLDRVAQALDLQSAEAMEVRAVQVWRGGAPRPPEIEEVKQYLDQLT